MYSTSLSPVEHSTLETLAYFAQWQRALTGDEIHQYLWNRAAFPESVHAALTSLFSKQILEREDAYFGLSRYSIEATVDRQLLLEKRRARALDIAAILQKVPQVEAVLLMNSTAMQTCHLKSDLDFFIITRPNSLYSTRALVLSILKLKHLAKDKAHHAGRACLGHWLDLGNLSLQLYRTEPHYAAYWLATMVPLVGFQAYKELIWQNQWVYDYLPNWRMHTVAHLEEIRSTKHEARSTEYAPRALVRTPRSDWRGLIEPAIFKLSRWKILRDHEFKNSPYLVCAPQMLKMYSSDKCPMYAQRMQSILDILLEDEYNSV